ncbi:uncharacterized protein [Apostichopus japonicus]|uniref:uncharacterized protein n=1 Tax=Stichopus japonicus TaxID=307972 RepID=UPI003AB86EE9
MLLERGSDSSQTSYEDEDEYEDDDEDEDDDDDNDKDEVEDSEEEQKTEVSDGLTIIEDDTDLPTGCVVGERPFEDRTIEDIENDRAMDILKSLGTEAAESDTSRPLFSDHESVDELEVKEERNDRDDAAMEQDRDGDDEWTGGEDRDGDDEGTGGEDRDGDDEGTGGEDRDGDDKGPDVDRDGDDEGTGLASRAKRPRLGEPKRKPRQCPLCEGMFVRLATHLKDSHNVAMNRDNRLLNQARTQKVQRSGKGKGAEGRTLRDCPVPGCPSTALLRIDQHLRRCHGFEKSSQEYMLWLAAARATVPETDPPSPEKAKPSAHSKIPKKLDDKAVLDRFLSYEAAMVGGTGPNLKQAEQHRRQVEILLQRLEVNSIAGLVDPLSVQRTANLLREDKKAVASSD